MAFIYDPKMSDAQIAKFLHDESIRRLGAKMTAFDDIPSSSKLKWVAAAVIFRETLITNSSVSVPPPSGAQTYDLRTEAEKLVKFATKLSLSSVTDQRTLRELCYGLRRALKPGVI